MVKHVNEKRKSNIFDKTEAVISSISRIFSYIGTGVVVIMMLLTVADVFMRYTFRSPVVGTLELTEYCMVIIAFFALGWCEIRRRHISVDLLVGRFPSRTQAIIASITNILGLAVLIPLTWQNWLRVQHEFEIQRASTMLSIPDYPFFLALVIGCVIFILAVIINLAKSVRGTIRK
jgi:TRAP-type transport system small permease protein